MKTCSKCENFLKKNWNDKTDSFIHHRNGMCKKYDYNIDMDSNYAERCKGYKQKKYMRIISKHNAVYISEYNAPDDFECVLEKQVNNTLTRNTGDK